MQHQSIEGGGQRCVGLVSSLLVHFLVVTCSMLCCKHVELSFGSRSTVQQYKAQVINNT